MKPGQGRGLGRLDRNFFASVNIPPEEVDREVLLLQAYHLGHPVQVLYYLRAGGPPLESSHRIVLSYQERHDVVEARTAFIDEYHGVAMATLDEFIAGLKLDGRAAFCTLYLGHMLTLPDSRTGGRT